MVYKIIFAALFIATLVLTLYFGLTTDDPTVPPKWVAVGSVPDDFSFQGILYSSSGKKWSDSTTGSDFDDAAEGQGIAYSPEQNRWVAVGNASDTDQKKKYLAF